MIHDLRPKGLDDRRFLVRIARMEVPIEKDKDNIKILKHLAAKLAIISLSLWAMKDWVVVAEPSSLLHYGTYCGPGPDRSVNTKPLDAFDSICRVHDIDYSLCQPEWGSSLIPVELPAAFPMNQFVSIRGKLPSLLNHEISLINPSYINCIHRADKRLVQKLRALEAMTKSRQVEASFSSQPVKEQLNPKTCLLGIKYGNDGSCFLSSYSFFTSIALDLFSSDLEADEKNLDALKQF